jgi:hypothetical protein
MDIMAQLCQFVEMAGGRRYEELPYRCTYTKTDPKKNLGYVVRFAVVAPCVKGCTGEMAKIFFSSNNHETCQ